MICHGMSFWFSYFLLYFVVLFSCVMFWLSSLCPFSFSHCFFGFYFILLFAFFVFFSFSFSSSSLLPVSCVFAAFDF